MIRLLRYWPFILLTIVSLVVGWQLLLKGYFPMHDDLQVMRLYQMRRCFNDGQIPCRWSPDMDNNYGQPMFNYYSAFPYYFGMIFNLLGVSFVDIAKLLFLLSLVASAIFTYLLARKFFSQFASLLTAAAYLIASYHALDIYVRGALAESWGLAFIPAVFYSLTLVIGNPSLINSLILAVTSFLLLITHNLTVLMNAPFLILWTLTLLSSPRLGEVSRKAGRWSMNGGVFKQLKFLILGGLLGVGLSAFFLFPVLLEQSLTQGAKFLTADYFNFRAHFTTINQLFLNTKWAYGPSKFGPDDDISFYLGIVQIFALIVAPFTLIWTWLKQKKNVTIVSFFFLMSLLAIFMTHGKSDPIWTVVPKLAYVQFPWRFLGPAIFGCALMLGAFANLFKPQVQPPILVVGLVALLVANFSYYRFEKWFYWINDEQKLSGELYNLQVRAAVLDYLPSTVPVIPIDKAPADPQVLSGDVNTNYFDKRSAYFAAEFDIKSDSATIQFPVMYFPNWQVYVDRGITPYDFSYDNDYGLITVKLSRGHHLVQAFLRDTPVRTVSNLITFVSLLTIISLITLKYANKDK